MYQNFKDKEDKLGIGQDNDIALTRTVLSNINKTINVVDAAKLRYPKAYVKDEGRYKTLYTSDQEQGRQPKPSRRIWGIQLFERKNKNAL